MMAIDDTKGGITWGDICQKFENMCLEVEDTMFEETVEYLENQMQIVGESVKKLYSGVMQDLLPPSSCDLDETAAAELPVDRYADADFCNESSQGSKKITVNATTEQATEDSSINHDVDNDAIYAKSFDTDTFFMRDSGLPVERNNFILQARRYARSCGIKLDLDSDENQQNKKIHASKTAAEIALSEKDTCSTSQSFEFFNVNQNHEATVSKSASAEVTALDSVADYCNEIDNASSEETPSGVIFLESAKEQQMNLSSSYSVLLKSPYGFSVVRTKQPEEYSFNTKTIAHPEIRETWSFDIANVDTAREQGHTTMQQDDELKLEDTCVMVTSDELQLVPKARVNLKTSKKKRWQPFSLSKKSARKQEYEELAIWHGKGDCMESLCPTLLEDQTKSFLPDISEPEWEIVNGD